MAPPGRQKSERAFCLFGGVFLRPACRAVCRGGRSCAACRCCGGFCARCPVFFLPVCRCLVPGLRLSAVFCLACAACLPFGRRRLCFRLAGSLPLLCLARAAGACLPFARRALCVHGFSLLFFLFPASLLPLKLLFICRSGRDGNFLACPLPRLCSRPAGLVTCCFFAGFCTHCLPCALCAQFRLVLVVCLPVLCWLHALFSYLFLFGFYLSKFFSFVAQAATGLYFLPKRK